MYKFDISFQDCPAAVLKRAKETIEGDELEALLGKSGTAPAKKRAVATVPKPEKAKPKTKPVSKKAPVITEPTPKTSPGYI